MIIGPFKFDPADGRLWNDHQCLRLRPKAAAVLHYLASHPRRLITRKELHQHIWPDTSVTSTALRVQIREIRAALGDRADAPQYIETIGRRGYRFLVDCPVESPALPAPVLPTDAALCVGRQDEIEVLQGLLARAAEGEPQIVFISGEAGIGKTTLVDQFVARIANQDDLWMTRGRCVEHYGDIEPYLPLLEILTSLCRGPQGSHVRAVLHQYAPMWLLQMQGLLAETEIEALRRRLEGMTRGRMLRELAETIDVMTTEKALVLVLEDLHWSDPSTLEWLRYIGQRQGQSRLLIIGTYRPAEAMTQVPELSRIPHQLSDHGHCQALMLHALTENDARTYVRERLGYGEVSEELFDHIYQHAGGHPLFLKHIVDHMLDNGHVIFTDGRWTVESELAALELQVPESLWRLLNAQIERLSPTAQQALEVASVAGEVFAVASVAAGMQCELEDAEVLCDELMKQSHLIEAQALEVWPDQTVSSCYRFQHALYRQVAYERVGPGRAIWLHRRIGNRLEQGYGAQASSVANQLVSHFEAGGEQNQAERYRLQAAQNAMDQHAYQEAAQQATEGLKHLDAWQDTRERTQHEFALHGTLGHALSMSKGFNDSEAVHHFSMAWSLASHALELSQYATMLSMIAITAIRRGATQRAQDMNEQLYRWACSRQDPVLQGLALRGLGMAASMQGDFVDARRYFTESQTFSVAVEESHASIIFGQNQRVANLAYLAWVLWWLGYPDQALQRGEEALALAQQSSNPFSLTQAHIHLSHLRLFRQETHLAYPEAQAALTIAREYEFPLWEVMAVFITDWSLSVEQEHIQGFGAILQGLTDQQTSNRDGMRPYWLSLLAGAQLRLGQTEAAKHALEEAFAHVDATGVTCWQAELLRLKGELLMAQEASTSNPGEAEACFQSAIAMARLQHAKSWELRAAMSLGRLWQRHGKQAEAHQLLADVYNWFTEGFDTADLQEAKTLLAELERIVF